MQISFYSGQHVNEVQYNIYSIKDIAVMVGFNDSSSFIRTFKKYEGISPGRFVDNNQN